MIEGTLPSVKYDGEWIYLVPMENAPGRVDSVKITNASFSFSGQGEEMRVLRLRHLLRIYIQELLVVTEPDMPSAAENRAAWGVLEQFEKPFLTLFGE